MRDDEASKGNDFWRYRAEVSAVISQEGAGLRIAGPERETREQAEYDVPDLYAIIIERYGETAWEERQGSVEIIAEIRYQGLAV